MSNDDSTSGDSTGDDPFVTIERGDTVWKFEREFLTSNWRCLYGDGCKGILTHEAEHLQQGCCSLGAHFGDGEPGRAESRQVSAYVAMLTPDQWEYYHVGTVDHHAATLDAATLDAAASDDLAAGEVADDHRDDVAEADTIDGVPWTTANVPGFYGDSERTHTRVVDGACIFLNRPGFAGGAGCALHIAALAAGDSPTEWKPSVCWQLPLRVDWALVDDNDPDGPETATVRRWSRTDWGHHGTTMAWCCTERSDGGEAFSGDQPVVDSLADELAEVAGHEVYVELRRTLRNTADGIG
jgi:hypothetical protein